MKKEESLPNIIKFILSILFIVCLLDMPYGYFQLVRFLALVGFVMLAKNANERRNQTGAIIYILLAILFQPIIKIPLGREIWNLVDVIITVGLIASIFFPSKFDESNKQISDRQ